MSDGLLNSALPPRNHPKAHFSIDSAAYFGLDLSHLDVGDDVLFVIRGEVKEKAVSQHDKEERRVELVVKTIEDHSPKDNRI